MNLKPLHSGLRSATRSLETWKARHGDDLHVEFTTNRREFERQLKLAARPVENIRKSFAKPVELQLTASGAGSVTGILAGVKAAHSKLDGDTATVGIGQKGGAATNAVIDSVRKNAERGAALNVDSKQARAELAGYNNTLRQYARSWGQQGIRTRVIADITRASANLRRLETLADSVSGERRLVVDAEVLRARGKLQALQETANALGVSSPTISVGLRGHLAAGAQMLGLQGIADRLDGYNVRMSGSVDSSLSKALPSVLGALEIQLGRVKTIQTSIAAVAMPLMLTKFAAMPAVISTAGIAAGGLAQRLGVGLTGALGSVGGALGLGGAALLGYGGALRRAYRYSSDLTETLTTQRRAVEDANKNLLMAKTALEEATKGTRKYELAQRGVQLAQEQANHEQAKYNALLATVTPNLLKLQKAVNGAEIGMIRFGGSIADAVAPAIVHALETWRPFAGAVSSGAVGMVRDMNKVAISFMDTASRGQNLRSITTILRGVREAGVPALGAVTNSALIFVNTLQAIVPSSLKVLNYMDRMTEAGRRWSASAEGQSVIGRTWAGMVKEGQRLWRIAVDLGHGLWGVSRAIEATGVGNYILSGLETYAQKFRNIMRDGGGARREITSFGRDTKPVLAAAGGVALEAGRQFLRMANAVQNVGMRNEETGKKSTVLVEILRALRRSLAPIADLLIHEFETIGPMLPKLIENLAKYFNVFARATPEMQFFLRTFNRLLGWFVDLPKPVQIATARTLAYVAAAKALGGGAVLSGIGAVGRLGTQIFFLNRATKAIAGANGLAAVSGAAGTAGTAAGTAGGKFSGLAGKLGRLSPLVAVGGPVVLGLAALAAGLGLAYVKSDKFRAKVNGLASDLASWGKNKFNQANAAINDIFDIDIGVVEKAGTKAGDATASAYQQAVKNRAGGTGEGSIGYELGFKLTKAIRNGIAGGFDSQGGMYTLKWGDILAPPKLTGGGLIGWMTGGYKPKGIVDKPALSLGVKDALKGVNWSKLAASAMNFFGLGQFISEKIGSQWNKIKWGKVFDPKNIRKALLDMIPADAGRTVIDRVQGMAHGINKALHGLGNWIEKWGRKIGDWIARPFEWAYNKLVGNSIVPDLVNGIQKWFEKLPGKIGNALKGLPGKVAGYFKFGGIFDGLKKAWKNLGLKYEGSGLQSLVKKVNDIKFPNPFSDIGKAWKNLNLKWEGSALQKLYKNITGGSEDTKQKAGGSQRELESNLKGIWGRILQFGKPKWLDIAQSVISGSEKGKEQGGQKNRELESNLKGIWGRILGFAKPKWLDIAQAIFKGSEQGKTKGGEEQRKLESNSKTIWQRILDAAKPKWLSIAQAMISGSEKGKEGSGNAQRENEFNTKNIWQRILDASGVWGKIGGVMVKGAWDAKRGVENGFMAIVEFINKVLNAVKLPTINLNGDSGSKPIPSGGTPSKGQQAGGPTTGGRYAGGVYGGPDGQTKLMYSGGIVPQNADGGVSDGRAPRAVYGEGRPGEGPQKETYAVHGRRDQIPYGESFANSVGMTMVPKRLLPETTKEHYSEGEKHIHKMADGGLLDAWRRMGVPMHAYGVTSGNVSPAMWDVNSAIESKHGVDGTTYANHGAQGDSTTSTDWLVADAWNTVADSVGMQLGNSIVSTLSSQFADKLEYIIWNKQANYSGKGGSGWEPYAGGGGYAAPSSPSGWHQDHVHASVTPDGQPSGFNGSGGGSSGGIGGVISSLWDSAGSALWDKLVQPPVDSLAGKLGGTGGIFGDIGSGLVTSTASKIKDYIIGEAGASSSGGSVSGNFSGDQAAVALEFAKNAVGRGMPGRLPVMTALQESSMQNLPGGHLDSAGYFQQRGNGAWGSYEDRTDPATSLGMFLDAAEPFKGDYSNTAGGLGQWAQAVQVSAFPDEYAKHWDAAASLIGDPEYYAKGGISGRSGKTKLEIPSPVGKAFVKVADTLRSLAGKRGGGGVLDGDRGGVGTGKHLVGITNEAGPEAIMPLSKKTPEGAMAYRAATPLYGPREHRRGATRGIPAYASGGVSGGYPVMDWNLVRNGRLGVNNQAGPMYSGHVANAMKAWGALGGVEIGPGNDVTVTTGYPGGAGMTYSDGRIVLSPNALNPPGVARHELGHALGHPHTGAVSQMNGAGYITDYDRAVHGQLWGKTTGTPAPTTGKTPPSSSSGGGSGSSGSGTTISQTQAGTGPQRQSYSSYGGSSSGSGRMPSGVSIRNGNVRAGNAGVVNGVAYAGDVSSKDAKRAADAGEAQVREAKAVVRELKKLASEIGEEVGGRLRGKDGSKLLDYKAKEISQRLEAAGVR